MTKDERRKARGELNLIISMIRESAPHSRERARLERRAQLLRHALMADAANRKIERRAA